MPVLNAEILFYIHDKTVLKLSFVFVLFHKYHWCHVAGCNLWEIFWRILNWKKKQYVTICVRKEVVCRSISFFPLLIMNYIIICHIKIGTITIHVHLCTKKAHQKFEKYLQSYVSSRCWLCDTNLCLQMLFSM